MWFDQLLASESTRLGLGVSLKNTRAILGVDLMSFLALVEKLSPFTRESRPGSQDHPLEIRVAAFLHVAARDGVVFMFLFFTINGIIAKTILSSR